MTLQTQMVIRALLDDPMLPLYGSQVSEIAGLPTGTIYPILTRLEREAGWLESFWEDPQIGVSEGRPRRRYYRLKPDGIEAARIALAQSYQSKLAAKRSAPRFGAAGATS